MSGAVEILRAARERITDPERWTQGYYASTPGGEQVEANDPDACRWCAFGSVLAELGLDLEGDRPDKCKPLALLVDALPAGERAVSEYNDCRGHPDVLALYDRAIELAENGTTTQPVAQEMG